MYITTLLEHGKGKRKERKRKGKIKKRKETKKKAPTILVLKEDIVRAAEYVLLCLGKASDI